MNEQMMNTSGPQNNSLNEIMVGLRLDQKKISPKFLYDEKGSELFEKICDQEEYYLTRSENKIMKAYAHEMSRLIGPNSMIIEPGSGNAEKVLHLLLRLNRVKGYIPVEINNTALQNLVRTISMRMPKIQVFPVNGDFTQISSLPSELNSAVGKKVVFIPGSTLGNLTPEEMKKLISNYSQMCGSNVAFLLGMDLKKDENSLELAYNDSEGITAAFNLNLLSRLNRDFDAKFDPNEFYHHAVYNKDEGRVEMHLVSKVDQQIKMQNEMINMKKGESIHTENSYKYSIDEFCNHCQQVGLKLRKYWKDPESMFCMYYFEKE